MAKGFICYAGLGSRMHPRNFVFITVMTLCHLQLAGQMLTNALPPSARFPRALRTGIQRRRRCSFRTIPVRRFCPLRNPSPVPDSGVPVRVEADRQTRVGDMWTLSGNVVIHYRDYIVRADKIIYHQSTSELEAEGHLQVTGGPAMRISRPPTAKCG